MFIHSHTSRESEVPKNRSCFVLRSCVRLWWMEGSFRSSACPRSKSAKERPVWLGEGRRGVEEAGFLVRGGRQLRPAWWKCAKWGAQETVSAWVTRNDKNGRCQVQSHINQGGGLQGGLGESFPVLWNCFWLRLFIREDYSYQICPLLWSWIV